MLVNEEDWINNEAEEESNLTPRRLTIDDLTPVAGLSKEDAGYYLSMSCKALLLHQGDILNQKDFTEFIMLKYPKFHTHKITGLYEIYKQVVNLMPEWYPNYQLQQTPNKPELTRETFFQQLGELIIQYKGVL